MATHTSLSSLFSDIADAIRNKTGDTGTIIADNFPTAIANIETGSDSQPPLSLLIGTDNIVLDSSVTGNAYTYAIPKISSYAGTTISGALFLLSSDSTSYSGWIVWNRTSDTFSISSAQSISITYNSSSDFYFYDSRNYAYTIAYAIYF